MDSTCTLIADDKYTHKDGDEHTSLPNNAPAGYKYIFTHHILNSPISDDRTPPGPSLYSSPLHSDTERHSSLVVFVYEAAGAATPQCCENQIIRVREITTARLNLTSNGCEEQRRRADSPPGSVDQTRPRAPEGSNRQLSVPGVTAYFKFA